MNDTWIKSISFNKAIKWFLRSDLGVLVLGLVAIFFNRGFLYIATIVVISRPVIHDFLNEWVPYYDTIGFIVPLLFVGLFVAFLLKQIPYVIEDTPFN